MARFTNGHQKVLIFSLFILRNKKIAVAGPEPRTT